MAGGADHGRAGFHRLGSPFADGRIAEARDRLARGETLYLAGLGAPGTHNSGVALVEVTQAHGPRLILNNEEERFSGNKHTSEYPRASIEAMVATLRGMGRDIADIFAWLTSWDYPALAGTLARTVLEEAPQSLRLLRTTEAAGFDGRRLDQMTRTPKILGKQLGLAGRVPLIVMPHHDNHAWFLVSRPRPSLTTANRSRLPCSTVLAIRARCRSTWSRTARCGGSIATTACSTRLAPSTA